MAQHKWHKEIKAWADGAEIEYRELGWEEWVVWGVWNDNDDPHWDNYDYEFRIKPQPKEPQYLYVYEDSFYGDRNYDSRASTRIMNKRVEEFEANYIGKIKLETEE